MKRSILYFVFSFSLVLLNISSAYSQITVNKVKPKDVQLMRVLEMDSSVILIQSGDEDDFTYFLETGSSNSYDNSFILNIGHNKKECLESLNELFNLSCSEKGSTFELDQGLYGQVSRGKKLLLSDDRHAGIAIISHSQLSKITDYFNSSKIE